MKISYYNNLKTFLSFLIVIIFVCINISAYEQHLFHTQSKTIMVESIIFLIFFHSLIVFFTKRNITWKKSYLFNFFMFYLLYLFIINFFQAVEFSYIDYSQIIKLVLITVLLLYLYLFFEQNELINLLKGFFYIGIGLSIINILIMTFNGFFIWKKIYIVRGASIFYDPNFFAAFNMFLILFYYFYMSSKDKRNYILLIILFTSQILTFTKASILALSIVFFFYYLSIQKTLIKKIIYIFIAISFLLIAFVIVKEIPDFRLEMMGNNRGNMALFFFHNILEHPFLGFSEKGIELQLVTHNLVNHSFHSFILDKSFAYGMLAFVFIFAIFIFTSLKLFFSEKKLFWVWLGLIINSFFIDYSIGGYGPMSLILTILFVYASKCTTSKLKFIYPKKVYFL